MNDKFVENEKNEQDGQEEIKNKVSEMTEKKSGKKEDDYNELNG